jgi:galactokinase
MGEEMKKKLIVAEANGRVNLIGEHTDYNGGWVLPTAIPQKTVIKIKFRNDRLVNAKTELPQDDDLQRVYVLGTERRTKSWIDYLQGCTDALLRLGFNLSGFDVEITSTIPAGSGLSSSAALLIAFLKALREAFSIGLTDLEVAKLAQKIEINFVGANVGIMDQMACSFASEGQAIYIDTKTLEFERVQLPLNKMDLVVINSGVEHQHSGGDYNQRRSECEQACRILGITELRQLAEKDLPLILDLPDVLMRRVRHVVTENERVHRAVGAIRNDDLVELGKLFYASHISMRDDYQVSISAIDTLVELCCQHPATLGARLTGGGFGGSIVAITEYGQGKKMAELVSLFYHNRTGNVATILVPNFVAPSLQTERPNL